MGLGNKLKSLRLQRNMTQIDLAKKAQVAQSVISDVENGKRKHGVSVIYLQRIAQALGVSVEELLKDDDNATHAS
ncbi:anaerobic benzoate catabolism transcriptional regulator [Anoxybacillus sp. BCO1]|uniref:HTH cro/C1-type domain-containing protein n=1 Tax=Anoxybacillus flavithermus TaxID=33934 RepID=A0A094JIJ4_9BACL|nr:hypothetical protein JS44_10560 [Anoxybacillus flavithermus]KHF27812.1 anaerobic benzoate catabolism transcriptional regulator [Anoxybacillus sp. BCO1]